MYGIKLCGKDSSVIAIIRFLRFHAKASVIIRVEITTRLNVLELILSGEHGLFMLGVKVNRTLHYREVKELNS